VFSNELATYTTAFVQKQAHGVPETEKKRDALVGSSERADSRFQRVFM
jgi:hypothetical protein